MITATVKSGHMLYTCTTTDDYATMCGTFATREALPERTQALGANVTVTYRAFVKPGASTHADTYVSVALLTRNGA
jgi:hypothetical protein